MTTKYYANLSGSTYLSESLHSNNFRNIRREIVSYAKAYCQAGGTVHWWVCEANGREVARGYYDYYTGNHNQDV